MKLDWIDCDYYAAYCADRLPLFVYATAIPAGLVRLWFGIDGFMQHFQPLSSVPIPWEQFVLALWCFCLAGIARGFLYVSEYAMEYFILPSERIAWGMAFGLVGGLLIDQSLAQFAGWLVPRSAIHGLAVMIAAGGIGLGLGAALMFREEVRNSARKKAEKHLSKHVPLLGDWLRRRAVRILQYDGSPEAMSVLTRSGLGDGDRQVRTLAEAVAHGDDDTIRRLAMDAIGQKGDYSGLQTIFDVWVESPHVELQRLLQQCLSLPGAPTNLRVLFSFLTEQWDRYETLDLDHSLLQASYQAGGELLRKRIAERARQSGRAEWVEAASGGRQGRRMTDMTDLEWQAVLEVLTRRNQWPDVWRLAQQAPPVWSSRLLAQLRQSCWQPAGADRNGYAELQRLAREWRDPVLHSDSILRCQQTLRNEWNNLRYMAISLDGRMLAGAAFSHVGLWGLPGGRPLHTLHGHTSSVECLAFSPDGRLLASGGHEEAVRLWGLPNGQPLQILHGHKSWVSLLAISSDGRLLASAGLDKTVRLWGLPNGQPLKALKGHTDSIHELAISPNGQLLATASSDTTVRLWGLPDGQLLKTLRGHGDSVCRLAITPDGRMLVTGSNDKTVRLWSLPNGEPLKTLQDMRSRCLRISPDGRLLVIRSESDLNLVALPEGQPVAPVLCGSDTYLDGEPTADMAISPDGRLLATGGHGRMVRLWSLPEGQRVKTLEAGGSVSQLAFSPDGRLLAIKERQSATIGLWTSDLVRLSQVPVGQMSLEDLEWAQQTLREGQFSTAERQALEFMVALMLWRRRFDIQVEETSRHIVAGEFDIEIEG